MTRNVEPDTGMPKLSRTGTRPTPPSSSNTLSKYKDAWRSFLDTSRFGQTFDIRVADLAALMNSTLHDVFDKTDARNKAIEDMTSFLRGDDKGYAIDSCVRSLILFSLVEEENSAATLELIKIVIDCERLLPFETPNPKPNGADKRKQLLPSTMKQRCKANKHWECRKTKKSTPFHLAAANGHQDAVKYMIQGIRTHYRDSPVNQSASWIKILQLEDPERTDGPTALESAVNERHTLTLKELLRCPQIALGPDKSFRNALKKGESEIVEIFLECRELSAAFVTNLLIIQALESIPNENADSDDRDKRMKILCSLLKRATTVDDKTISTIIEKNLIKAWEQCEGKVHLDNCNFLHLAVSSQNIEFVERFVKQNPKLVMKKAVVPMSGAGDREQGYYPLWYNNRKWENNGWVDRKGSPEIRTTLVTAAMKQIEKMQLLSDVLQQSAETARELCFDISQISPKSCRLRDFIQSLISHKENEVLLSYESTIKYASFPALDLHADDKESFGKGPCRDHGEVFAALDWLKETKKVTSILELKVPDRLFNPHNELKIAHCVETFGVEVLNWRFLDLSLSIFSSKVKERMKTLHLYSSGKRAAISHWLSEDGLKSFKNLSKVHVHLIQETMTEKYLARTRKYLNSEFRERFPQSPRWEIRSRPWNPTRGSATNLDETAQRAFPQLSGFISSYRDYISNPSNEKPSGYRPTKVAIIDNGILSMSPESSENWGNANSKNHKAQRNDDGNTEADDNPANSKTLWTRIKEGRSFVDDDYRVSPWLFASDPHGTQMANLICALDPGSELYIAKVADGRNGITLERVSRAIHWARGKNVDIISMSFAMHEATEALKKSISGAYDAGIAMFCSSHDEGSNTLEAWPAEAPGTKTVVACDEVAAGAVPFLASDDRISGSSVATATAAGLGSLMLSCARLSKQAEGCGGITIMDAYFKAMLSNETSKYVRLDKFGNIDAKIKEGEPIDAASILHNNFFRVDP